MGQSLRVFICTIALIFIRLSFAGPGDHVNNGGSLAKSNVTFAYQNLHKFIDLCLALKSCELEPFEHELLNKIKINLDRERSNSQQLQFLYGKERPDIFLIDGEFKAAVTGNHIGDPIYFNLDLIAGGEEAKDIFLEPIDIPQAIGLLVHEFGHHHGHMVHAELERLGGKVQRHAEGEIYRIDFGFFRQSESISYINYWPLEYRPELVVNLKEGFHDLGKYVQQALACPKNRNQTIASVVPRTFLLANIHWGETNNQGIDGIQRVLMGSLNMLCQGESLESSWYEVSFKLTLPLLLVQQAEGDFYRLSGEPGLEVLKLLRR